MQINWRYQLKGLFRVAVLYAALNLVGIYLEKDIRGVTVDVVVSVVDANTSKPVSNAVASWQENVRARVDCVQMVSLLHEQPHIGSRKAGIRSPGEGQGWRFALVAQYLFPADKELPKDEVPENVIGMTTKNGRLEFRGYFKCQTMWLWPHFWHVRADENRLLQVNAVGYQTKSTRFRREDFRFINGAYTLNSQIVLKQNEAKL